MKYKLSKIINEPSPNLEFKQRNIHISFQLHKCVKCRTLIQRLVFSKPHSFFQKWFFTFLYFILQYYVQVERYIILPKKSSFPCCICLILCIPSLFKSTCSNLIEFWFKLKHLNYFSLHYFCSNLDFQCKFKNLNLFFTS